MSEIFLQLMECVEMVLPQHRPRVTIGLPVFNGGKYLRFALDSILSQTYGDFELIISDNASTDETQLICQEYQLRDHRIRYFRNKKNLGIAKNHNLVFQLSLGEYFKWASHDDVLSPTFIEECVRALDKDQSMVLCHSKTGRIDTTGKLIGLYELGVHFTTKKSNDFSDIISMRNYAWLLILGLIRSSALKQTNLLGSYISADRNLLAELRLRGSFNIIPKILFFRREHPQAYTNKSHKSLQEKQNCWLEDKGSKIVFPYMKVFTEYFKSVKRSPMKWSEKQTCYVKIIKWLIREGWVLVTMDIGLNLITNQHILRILAPVSQKFIQKAGIK
ncbi:MAG: glycosyltransferase [Candidatus Bathyarchaeota archaeon]|nr:glycosyltransferase [Candidatus Bathyarchaeota archaeon]